MTRAYRTVFILSALFWTVVLKGQVVINEIYYEPPEKTSREEFIELYNPTDRIVDLSNWAFVAGISYIFPEGTVLRSGQYLVVAEDPEVVTRRFGVSSPVLGPFVGKLANDGESVVLMDAEGKVVDVVDYKVRFPWPLASAGDGSSIELINPSLDNSLGGSWRASGMMSSGNTSRIYFVKEGDSNWHYRKGTSEPPAAWREPDFTEDGTWRVARTVIGYGDGDDVTVLDDMRGGYSTLYLRHTFTIASPQDIPRVLKLAVYVDDGAVVWINGVEVGRFHVPEGELPHDARATSHEAEWEEVLVPNPGAILRTGTNVLAVHAVNAALASSDFSFDAALFVPAANEEILGLPTPGAQNSVYAENAPPQIRQVQHAITQPTEADNNLVTCRVTDPDGVASVELLYQVVRPGHYIPAFLPLSHTELLQTPLKPRRPNPEFEDPANWFVLPMYDNGTFGDEIAGDGIYSTFVPRQANRSLVRYRIRATDTKGAVVQVPYPDDPSLNFAYFVYNGVPDYRVRTSITGSPHVYPSEIMTSLAVYILIAREQDIIECVAADPALQIPQFTQARFIENWEGAIVYNGVVYDHITFRLRGANGRYQIPPGNPSNVAGKRHWRFKFNRGHHLQAYDRFGKPFPTKWKILNTGRMFGNRLDGNWGLGDQVNDIIWNAYGVPAAFGFAFHFRVLDGEQEAPSGDLGQYLGDFWGIARAFENYDGHFLDAHDLPKGNLYKLVNQTKNALEQLRYQAPYAVNDGSDHDNIENNLRPGRPDSWLLAYVNYHQWYHYHAIAQAIRHYDYWPDANKNAAWYFEPDYRPENSFFGRMNTFPFDADATWGPTWNQGRDRPYEAIYGGSGKPDFQKEYRNHIREVRDLLWQRDQLVLVIRQTASFMDGLEEPDIDRWRNAPAEAGRQYFPAPNQRSLEGKIADMLKFAFVGGNWPGGGVGAGGRAVWLDNFADGPDRGLLPDKPTIEYVGPDGYPADSLRFRAGSFSDPQGPDTFGAMMWRIAEVTDLPDPETLPLSDPRWRLEPVHLEIEALWESDPIRVYTPEITIPIRAVKVGRKLRVRVRMMDNTGRWSHWSDPVEFTAGPPLAPVPVVDALRITEIMYHPSEVGQFEFIELQNRSNEPIDLTDVRFTRGIKFDFGNGRIRTLDPGAFVVVVRDLDAFSRRYGSIGIPIAGRFEGKLDNDGDRITLTYGGNITIQDITYLDTWYPETDGLGYSLTVVDVTAPDEAWNKPENWAPSSIVGGTPGIGDNPGGAGGLLRPGDVNLDGRLDVSDAVGLLRLLFGGQGLSLPCEGEDPGEDGNLLLLDFNGDSRLNVADVVAMLGYLFSGGPKHALGDRCVRIEGCPTACWGL